MQTPTTRKLTMEETTGHGHGDHDTRLIRDHDARLIRDLCTLLVTIIAPVAAADTRRTVVARPPRMSPAAAASLLLGASLALMLCGTVTFTIGFLLMPWVAGVALLFGFAGVVSTLSSGLLPSPSKVQPLTSLPQPPSSQGRIRSSSPMMSPAPDKLVAWR